MLRLLCIIQILLLAFLAIESESKNTHLHRYMLDSYKAQHNPKTQMDYKRRRTVSRDDPTASAPNNNTVEYGHSKEPILTLTKSDRKVPLHELMVRIYQQNKYICMGTLISEMLVITASTCFDDDNNDVVTMKMFDDEALDGKKVALNQTYLKGADPMLVAIQLTNSPKNSQVTGDTVKLCDSELEIYEPIDLPLWIRSRHSIHSQTTYTIPIQACRLRMRDPEAVIATDTMICVKNMKYTAQCQMAIGNPLVHDERICGINVAGHNCPTFTGVNLYIRVYDALAFSIMGLKMIKDYRIEDTVL
ncbi:seminase [Drosophila erecta]